MLKGKGRMPPPPIDNRGATCYIATAAQCLFAMAEHSRAARDRLPEDLETIRSSRGGNGERLLGYHRAACAASKPPYPPHSGEMGEAPQAFQVMVEPIPEVHALVRGTFSDSYVCGGCKASIRHSEAYTAMPLSFDDRHGRVRTLPECIEGYFVPEVMGDYSCEACGIGHRCAECADRPEQGVKSKCGRCKAAQLKNTATVHRKAPEVPEFWLMHLVRAKPIAGVRVAKDVRPIQCSELIDMGREKGTDDVVRYKLRYVGHQIGADTGGHWYAESQTRDGKWWRCDDDKIAAIAGPSPSKGSAVMLLYQRVTEPRKRPSQGGPSGTEKRSRSAAPG